MKGFLGTEEGLGQLKGMWANFLQHAGKFRSYNIYKIEGDEVKNVHIRFHFETVDIGIVLSINPDHKIQGMLGLTFANESDYDLIQEDDTFNFLDLNEFAPGKPLTIEVVHSDGSKDIIITNHTYNDSQIEWYNEGSALNLIKKGNA